MKRLSDKDGQLLYEVSDDAQVGLPVYQRITQSANGLCVEVFDFNPVAPSRTRPQCQVHFGVRRAHAYVPTVRYFMSVGGMMGDGLYRLDMSHQYSSVSHGYFNNGPAVQIARTSDSNGKLVYTMVNQRNHVLSLKIIEGGYGLWVEIHRTDTIVQGRIPDVQFHFDYFDRLARLRFWRDGLLAEHHTDDVEPSFTHPLFTQKEDTLDGPTYL